MANLQLHSTLTSLLILMMGPLCLIAQQDDYLSVKAVGRHAGLGFLYDARTERFLGVSVFDESIPDEFIAKTETPSTTVKTSITNTYSQKLNLFDISAHLSASILSGMLTVEGSAGFLMSNEKSSRDVTGALLLKCRTVKQSLELYFKKLQNFYNTQLVESTKATHVVTGISWGADVVIIFKDTVDDARDETTITGSIEIEFKKLEGPFKISGGAKVNISGTDTNKTSTFSMSVQGDILEPDQLPTTYEEVTALIKKVPKLVSDTNEGKGVPIEFQLTPISLLRTHLESKTKENNFAAKVDDTILNTFITIFDQILLVEKFLRDDYDLFTKNSVCVLPETLKKVIKLRSNFLRSKTTFTTSFREMLIKVRSNNADQTELSELAEKYDDDEFSPSNVEETLVDFSNARKKVELYKAIVNSKGRIQYFGATNDLESQLVANTNHVIYILFQKSAFIANDGASWEDNIHTFLHVLNWPYNKLFVADCDFDIGKCKDVNRTIIKQIVKGKVVIEDVDPEIKKSKRALPLKVQGLGRVARIGELYDARTDTFLGTLILKSDFSKSLLRSTPNEARDNVGIRSENIHDRFKALNVQTEQQFSILAEIGFPLLRSGQFLSLSKDLEGKPEFKKSILFTTRTTDEELDTSHKDFSENVAQDNVRQRPATHFVKKIEHGFNSVVSVEGSCLVSETSRECALALPQFVEGLARLVSRITHPGNKNITLQEPGMDFLKRLEEKENALKIYVVSDIQDEGSKPYRLVSSDSFVKFLNEIFIPKHTLKEENRVPGITYYLHPIDRLQNEYGIITPNVPYDTLVIQTYSPLDVTHILDDVNLAAQQLKQLSEKFMNNANCILDADFTLLNEIKADFSLSLGAFPLKFRNTALQIKSGQLPPSHLEDLLTTQRNTTYFDNLRRYKNLNKLIPGEHKIRICEEFNGTNVQYLGKQTNLVYYDAMFATKAVEVSRLYVLFFKTSWLADHKDLWRSSSQFFVGQLSNRLKSNDMGYYVVDCDFDYTECTNLTRPTIFEYRNGILVSRNYTETVEVEETGLQSQLNEFKARVTGNIATVKAELTKNINDIARVTDKNAAVESKVTQTENDIVALRNGLDAANRTATQNQIKIRAEHDICEEVKPAFIETANKSASIGCGGTIQLQSEGESIVLDFNMAATTSATQRCLWTLDATQNNKRVEFKVKLTLLCKQPTHLLDDNTLTFTEWYGDAYGQNTKQLTTNRMRDYRGFLSFNAKRIYSEARFIFQIDVLDTRVDSSYYSSSSATHKESFGSASYSLPASSFDWSSIVINPQPAAKMTLTVDVDSSGESNPCESYNSVDILEFGMDGVPKRLGRLCGQQSGISYETENPVAALFLWYGWRPARGGKLSWK